MLNAMDVHTVPTSCLLLSSKKHVSSIHILFSYFLQTWIDVWYISDDHVQTGDYPGGLWSFKIHVQNVCVRTWDCEKQHPKNQWHIDILFSTKQFMNSHLGKVYSKLNLVNPCDHRHIMILNTYCFFVFYHHSQAFNKAKK